MSYLLHSSASLIILYAFYHFIVKYEYNHQLNRFAGLSCLLFSILLPVIPKIDLFESNILASKVYSTVYGSYDIQESLSKVAFHDSVSIYFIIYMVGVGIFSLRTFIGLATLIYYYFKSSKYHLRGFTVVTLNKRISPFTFFNVLYIGNQSVKNEDLDILLVHEQVHLDQFHSIDTLIMEFLTIIFWFNPAIWFFQRAIRAEHEYLADDEVLKKGICKLDYQRLLFQTKTGVSAQLGNYFLRSKRTLIKRFKMMTRKNKNLKKNYLRPIPYLFLIVLIFGLSSFVTTGIKDEPDIPAKYAKGASAMYETIAKTIKYPKNARDAHHIGLVHVSFNVSEQGLVENIRAEKKDGMLLEKVVVVGYSHSSETPKGVNDDLKSEAVEAVGKLGKFIPAQKDNKPVSSILILPIEFKLE